ncbi:helix-turn-helix domain-containing protein [Streptomyces sp. NPDC005181]|uniref:helix-turn-helix domain-containing protein n=1 Tax=Streptomyces sp. NPDC005181 TaxID=3156869 RepID=UPI00339DB525
MQRKASTGSCSVTARALQVLEAFAPDRPVLRLAQISRRTGPTPVDSNCPPT